MATWNIIGVNQLLHQQFLSWWYWFVNIVSICIHSNGLQHDDDDDDDDDETHNDDKTQRDGFEAKHADHFVNVIYFHNTLYKLCCKNGFGYNRI